MRGRGNLFYLICLGFGLGVLWRSFYHVGAVEIIYLAILYFSLILFSYSREGNLSIPLSFFVLALLFGVLRFQVADVEAPQNFETLAGQKITISGIIKGAPANGPSGVKFTLETDKENEKTGIEVFTWSNNKYQYGQEVRVSGKLQKPENFTTDQGLEFDYVNYLRKDGIFYTMRNPKIEIVSSDHGNFIKSTLLKIKDGFDSALAQAIPVPESTIMGGIILGERYAFSPSLKQLFMDTGTVHLVTIGGYHVTLVASWIIWIFSFLPMPLAFSAGLLSIFAYIIVTGAAQTSVRAGIMAALALLAKVTGRMYDAGHALVLAAFIMILINPFILAYDISFELSFISTIAIIFLSPRLESYLQWIRWKWLRDLTAISLSMYIFALPFILYRMGSLSLVALPANILIVPLLPITMIAGFVTGIVGLISPALALIPGNIAYGLLHFQITSIRMLADLPFASVTISNFPLALVILFYSIFFGIFYKR